MASPTHTPRLRVGALRPSQLMYSYGVGSIVDLPNLSVLVGGLSDWSEANQREISEDRLLAAVQVALGQQVTSFRSAPWMEETRNPTDEWARTGIPVMPFPRWLRCSNPKCRLLSTIESGLFTLRPAPFRPERTQYVHEGCGGRGWTAIPARFVVACANGHLDDFPWIEFCHEKGVCNRPQLTFEDVGQGKGGVDAIVKCANCPAKRHMAQAFGEKGQTTMPRCRGRHPHLRTFERNCTETAKAMILGATNQWFPLTRSVLSIPASKDPVEQVVAEVWPLISACKSRDALDALLVVARQHTLKDILRLAAYPVDEVWTAIDARHKGAGSTAKDPADVLSPEWAAFSNPAMAASSDDFRVREVPPPASFASVIERVVLAERLREVTALTGFTRLESPDWDPGAPPSVAGAPITDGKPTWLPAAESRGEGLFIQLNEAAVKAWEDEVSSHPSVVKLEEAHVRWRNRRNLSPSEGWRGVRFLLLHSLAHALINEMSLECGYSTASIRERIYSHEENAEGAAMAGILLYTAASDSEGTLGGLVSLGEPSSLARLLARALDRARLCAADPLCAEHTPHETEDTLHNAACHACSFVPETSCQYGNRYLDRAVLVETLVSAKISYFGETESTE